MPKHVASTQKITDLKIILVTLFFLASGIVQIALELHSSVYDWDIDHEMYFGQALLRGELIWTKEFHDKLPLVQFFFAIPALFESVTVWRMISLLFIVGASIVLIQMSPYLFDDSKKFRLTGWLSTAVYLNLTVSMPSGITHINSVSASSAIIALMLMVIFFEKKNTPKEMVTLGFFISLFSTISISFRPYFLFALVPVAMLLSVNFVCRSGLYARSIRMLLVFLLGTNVMVFGFGVNGLPYLLTGQIEAFREGLSFILAGLNPDSAVQSFVSQMRFSPISWIIPIFSVLMVLIGTVWAVFALTLRQSGARFYSLLAISSWGLAIGILSQHWWAHYSNLFSWYFAIFGASLIVKFFQLTPKISNRKNISSNAGVIAAFFFLSAVPFILSGIYIERSTNHESQHSESWTLESIKSFLVTNDQDPVSFLSPESMYAHWKLGEPRYGFPHAANTWHIQRGWWANSQETKNFTSPKSSTEYCELIHHSSVDVIFVQEGAEIMNCARIPDGRTDLKLREVISRDGNQLEVWERVG